MTKQQARQLNQIRNQLNNFYNTAQREGLNIEQQAKIYRTLTELHNLTKHFGSSI